MLEPESDCCYTIHQSLSKTNKEKLTKQQITKSMFTFICWQCSYFDIRESKIVMYLSQFFYVCRTDENDKRLQFLGVKIIQRLKITEKKQSTLVVVQNPME